MYKQAQLFLAGETLLNYSQRTYYTLSHVQPFACRLIDRPLRG
jgi:hypothetical protein